MNNISIFKEQTALRGQFMENISDVDIRIARVEELIHAQTDQLQASQFRQVGSLYGYKQNRQIRRTAYPGSNFALHPEGLTGFTLLHYLSTQLFLFLPCPPAILTHFIGKLFIGYAGLPFFSSKCDAEGCQKSHVSQIRVEYWFPFGFFCSTILRIQLGYQANIGSRFHFDTLRRVPDSAQCVNFAVKGDIDGLKHPFSHGLASPRDTSTSRGYSLLRWALYAKQYETCKFLAYAGADPDYRPFASSDNSPRIKACHFLLEGCPSESGESALKSITQEGHLEDFIEDSRFTSIHRIVLGLCLLDLNTEVAARGDSHTIFVLLNHGADPNITDTQLSGPISNAAARGHTVCVRLLLEAGGDPDPPLPSGVRKGSPLIIATRNAADTMLLKSLLDFGANVNSRGSDG
ncbi:hypothetical protein LOZ66_004921 [Ophidiomyces ophidiicola]|nr:hypothetical protein LOZ66_004921 [Ophidiomyces ophidiicola]